MALRTDHGFPFMLRPRFGIHAWMYMHASMHVYACMHGRMGKWVAGHTTDQDFMSRAASFPVQVRDLQNSFFNQLTSVAMTVFEKYNQENSDVESLPEDARTLLQVGGG